MFKTIFNLYALLDRKARLHIGLLAFPMMATAVLEMASIALVLPLIQSLMSNGQGSVSQFLDFLWPNVSVSERLHLVTILFVAAFLIKSVAYAAITHLINRVIYMKSAIFAQRMFEVYAYRPLRFHLGRNSAEVVRNLTTGSNRAFEAIRIIMSIGLEGVLVLATFVLLLMFQPMLTLVAGLTLMVIALIYYRFSSPVFERWGADVQTLDGNIIQSVNQAFGSIRDVKILHCEEILGAEFGGFSRLKARYLSRMATMQHVPRLALESVMVVGLVAAIFILIGDAGSLSDVFSTLGLFGMASLRLMPSMSRIMQGAGNFRNRTAFVDTIHRDLIEGLRDSERMQAGGQREDLIFRRELVLERLALRHPNADTQALKDVSLRVGHGESVGIVGASGAGKTTLMDVVMGLLPPDSGAMQVDGADIMTRLGAWQRHIGYVPQQVYLNDDTLRRNIAFGLPDDALDDVRLAQILRLAQLDDIVASLPEGLDTMLGEHGLRLSGGERQRVAIARALSRDPDVLVFDEATSALDNETEQSITRAIESMVGEKTIIIIAHRLSTVRSCTKLVYMQNGRVAAVGSFESLLASNSDFRRLAEIGGLSSVESVAPERD